MKKLLCAIALLNLFSLMACDGHVRERVEFHDNERIKSITTYNDYERHGKYVEYFAGEKKEVKILGQYKNNKKDGVWKEWDGQGRLRSERNFKEGFRHGSSKTWDKNGKLREEYIYEEGEFRECKSWDENGQLKDQYGTKDGPRCSY